MFITYTFLSISVLLIGIFNVAFGPTGGALILILALALPSALALQVHAIISSISSLFRAINFYQKIDWYILMKLTIFSVPGYVTGAFFFSSIPETYIQILIGLFFLTFSSKIIEPNYSNQLSNLAIFRNITVACFATVFIGGTGVLIAPTVYNICKSRRASIGTLAAYLVFHHIPKIWIYHNYFDLQTIDTTLVYFLTISSLIGTSLGKVTLKHINHTFTFQYIRYANIFFSSCLIVSGVIKLVDI